MAVAFFCCVFNTTKAQDIHFTHISYSPIYTNPAFTGYFDGHLRLYANYRNQYYSALGKASFQTTYGSADLRIPVGIGCKDFFGVGIVAYNDRFGENILKTNNVSLSLSYSKALAEKRKHSITVGGMATYFQRSLDTDVAGYQFGSQFDGISFDPSLNSGEIVPGTTSRNVDFSLGVLYFGTITRTFDMYVGFSLAHIIRPEWGFNSVIDEPLSFRYSGQLGTNIRVGENIKLAPLAFVNHQNKITEITIGSPLKYLLIRRNEQHTYLVAGLYARLLSTPVKTLDLESIIAIMGVEYEGLRFTFGYDANLNGLKTATRSQGAFEVSVRFQMDMFRCKPFDSHCPTF